MAFISTSEVKQIRNALKERFGKDLKFSVRREHYSNVDISLVSGNINFYDGSLDREDKWNDDAPVNKFDGYAQINEYYTENYGKHKGLLNEIVHIVKTSPDREWFDKSDAMTDYFHTAYYFNINIGKWDKPYVFTGAK